MKFMKIKHLILALALSAAAPFAAAAFNGSMNLEQVEAEMQTQLATGATLVQVAQNALAAGLSPALVTTALLNATTVSAEEVVTAMLLANAPLQAVVNAALAAGVSRDAVTRGALAAKVTLINVVAAINSSPSTIGGTGNVPRPGGGPGGSVSPS